ncbi:MAG: ATP-binding protein, partial [Spirochaetota bacterium]
NEKNFFQQIRISYFIVIGIILLLTICGQMLIQRLLKEQGSQARIINMAGKQRMLSQKLSKLALLAKQANATQRKALLVELQTTLDTFESANNTLANPATSTILYHVHSSKNQKLYRKLKPYYEAICSASHKILQSLQAEKNKDFGVAVEQILQHEAKFLITMDRIVLQYEIESNIGVQRIEKTEYALLVSIVLAIILELRYIFNPLFEKFKNYILQIEQSSQQIKKLNSELYTAVEQAKQASKYKSEFLANMSHEIRTPLNSILGFSEILQEKEADAKKIDFLKRINTNGKNLLNLINDILDLSKIEAGKIDIQEEELYLKNYISNLKDLFYHSLRAKGLTLETSIPDTFPELIFIDSIRLNQILINLLGNAIKFTERGNITCKVTVLHLQETTLDFEINIIDTGIGIPTSQQEYIFESFRQQDGQDKRRYEGTGLGLAICKKLAELMQGNIYVSSIPNKGSTFTVRFYNISYASPQQQQEIENSFTVKFFPSPILVVDDIQENLQVIQQFLSKEELVIHTANSGEECLEKLQTITPAIILMDIQMPDMDGFETSRKIKAIEKFKDTPILCVTASAFLIENEDKGKDLFSAHLYKPIVKQKLVQELKKFIPYRIVF